MRREQVLGVHSLGFLPAGSQQVVPCPRLEGRLPGSALPQRFSLALIAGAALSLQFSCTLLYK